MSYVKYWDWLDWQIDIATDPCDLLTCIHKGGFTDTDASAGEDTLKDTGKIVIVKKHSAYFVAYTVNSNFRFYKHIWNVISSSYGPSAYGNDVHISII